MQGCARVMLATAPFYWFPGFLLAGLGCGFGWIHSSARRSFAHVAREEIARDRETEEYTHASIVVAVELWTLVDCSCDYTVQDTYIHSTCPVKSGQAESSPSSPATLPGPTKPGIRTVYHLAGFVSCTISSSVFFGLAGSPAEFLGGQRSPLPLSQSAIVLEGDVYLQPVRGQKGFRPGSTRDAVCVLGIVVGGRTIPSRMGT